MKNFAKQLVMLLVVAVVAIGAWFIFSKNSGQELSRSATNIQREAVDNSSEKISYQGKEGSSALKILEQNYQVKTKDTNGRLVVTAINSKTNNDGYAWNLYVNSKLSSVSADQYITKDSDTIEWQYEKL